jgi:hypothetical protein
MTVLQLTHKQYIQLQQIQQKVKLNITKPPIFTSLYFTSLRFTLLQFTSLRFAFLGLSLCAQLIVGRRGDFRLYFSPTEHDIFKCPPKYRNSMLTTGAIYIRGASVVLSVQTNAEDWRLLGCYGVTSQKAPFFIVTAVKTSNLREEHCLYIVPIARRL